MAFVYKLSIFLIAVQTAISLTNGYPFNTTTPITVKMPESCRGKTYCSEPGPNYPFEKIQHLLTNQKLDMFGVQVPDTNHRVFMTDEADVFTGCHKTNREQKQIYYIVDEHQDVRVVVQSNFFAQMVNLQECSQEKAVHSEVFDAGEVKKHDIRCVNLKLYYSFVVLSKNFDGFDYVQNVGGLPVACVTRIGKV